MNVNHRKAMRECIANSQQGIIAQLVTAQKDAHGTPQLVEVLGTVIGGLRQAVRILDSIALAPPAAVPAVAAKTMTVPTVQAKPIGPVVSVPAPAVVVTATPCAATTAKGVPCTKTAAPGDTVCPQHAKVEAAKALKAPVVAAKTVASIDVKAQLPTMTRETRQGMYAQLSDEQQALLLSMLEGGELLTALMGHAKASK